MNKSITHYASLVLTAACLSFATIHTAPMHSNNFITIRTLEADMARELVQTQKAWTGMGDDTWHGTVNAALQFQKNLKGQSPGLAEHVFWSGKNSMSVGLNTASASHDLDAFQLGLGSATGQTHMSLAPEVQQIGADIFFYAGSSEVDTGMWFKTHAPIGVIKINPHLSADNGTLQPGQYAAGVLDTNAVTAPYQTIQEAFAGGKSAGSLQALQKGKIDGEQSSGAKLGDLQVAVGYNFIGDTDYHLGAGLRVCAPTGNKPTGEYALEPIFGKAGSWTLGAELLGHWTFWRTTHNKNLQLWFDGHISHVFAGKQKRSFDLLANGPGSKYLLVADFNNGSNQRSVQNLVNVSTLDIESKHAVMVDLATQIRYEDHNWSAGLGYNLYGASKEKITPLGSLSPSRYAVIGQESAYNGDVKPNATMRGNDNAGTGAGPGTDAANRISGNEALDFDGAAHPAAWTSKVFGDGSYHFKHNPYAPYIGVYGSGEFSHSSNNAVSQWSVVLYTGLCF